MFGCGFGVRLGLGRRVVGVVVSVNAFAWGVESSGGGCDDRVGVVDTAWGTGFVVADGAGGMSGGALAAQKVVEGAERWLLALERAPTDLECAHWLTQTDQSMALERGVGLTTAVLLVVGGGRLTGASVGDSEATLWSAGKGRELTSMQHRKPLLGSGEAWVVPIASVKAQGMLLMCSDGLSKYAPYAEIERIMAHFEAEEDAERARSASVRPTRQGAGASQAVVGALIDAARMPNGGLQDDVGVILASLGTSATSL